MLLIERGIPPSSRLRSQSKYSSSMADGRKALVLKKVFSVSEALLFIDRYIDRNMEIER